MNGKQRLLVAIVLLSSLALNLFFGGIVVGKYFGQVSDTKFFHPPPMPRGPRWILESLPEASREKVRPLIQAHRQQMEPQIRSMREARREVHQQLTAADFNVEVLSEALARLEQEKQKGGQMMQQLLIDIASQLNEEDRQRLSEATRRRPRPPRDRDRGPDFDRPEWGKP
ncbi:MAG TPA: periplasmic heavy metal sensor [Thiotrichaceae bacterium]|nr:periplasmic heavy metal sensor [Thiotrichaceae bacterium]